MWLLLLILALGLTILGVPWFGKGNISDDPPEEAPFVCSHLKKVIEDHDLVETVGQPGDVTDYQRRVEAIVGGVVSAEILDGLQLEHVVDHFIKAGLDDGESTIDWPCYGCEELHRPFTGLAIGRWAPAGPRTEAWMLHLVELLKSDRQAQTDRA